MVKFIISNLSLSMFQDKNFNLKVREINEKEFHALSYGAYSHIGHTDIAEITGFEYNKDPVHARINDVLYLAQIYRQSMKYYEIKVEP